MGIPEGGCASVAACSSLLKEKEHGDDGNKFCHGFLCIFFLFSWVVFCVMYSMEMLYLNRWLLLLAFAFVVCFVVCFGFEL